MLAGAFIFSRYSISWLTCAVIHALTQQNITSDKQLMHETHASSPSQSRNIPMHWTIHAIVKRQLLHSIRQTSPSSCEIIKGHITSSKKINDEIWLAIEMKERTTHQSQAVPFTDKHARTANSASWA